MDQLRSYEDFTRDHPGPRLVIRMRPIKARFKRTEKENIKILYEFTGGARNAENSNNARICGINLSKIHEQVRSTF